MNDSEHPGAQASSGNSLAPGAPASRRRARPSLFWRLVKWTFAVGFCLALVAGGALFGKIWHNPAAKSAFTGVPAMDWLRGNPLASYTPANYFPDHPHTLNLLILGCDRDYVGKRVHGEAISVPVLNTNGRSDAILVAHFDFDKQAISVMTIPRDTAVHVPGHSTHKINAAHQFGGPKLTQETIKDAFGIDTDAFVTLHFEAFQKIVDTVDGVDINVKKQLDYDDFWAHLHIHLKPGLQHLNGYKAMGYVRVRHSDSDLMRAERQHEFLEALRNQIRSPKMLFKVSEILDSITDNLHTDLSTRQLLTLANWSKGLAKDHIALTTMPSIEGPVYVTVNRKPTRKMVAQIFFDGNEEAVTITAPDKATVYAMNHRGSRRRGRLHTRDAAPVDSGSDVPMEETPTAPDPSDTTQNSARVKPDSSGTTPKPDGGANGSDKKSNETGDKTKDPPPAKDPISVIDQIAFLAVA